MPLEQFVGYTIMDSIITYGKDSFPTSQAQKNFIESLTCTGDTLNYALKYLYLLADYNPFLYYNFLTSYQTGNQQPMSILTELLNYVGKKCSFPKQGVVKSEFILHLYVNVAEDFVYESQPGDYMNLTYAYCNVIDTIKGQVLPDVNNTINVFMEDSAGIQVKKATTLNVPSNTEFLFYYNKQWLSAVQPNKEYIVFSFITGACIGTEQYYDIRPIFLDRMTGVFPIVNGSVIDEKNNFGWGTSVPLATFKQNLQELIDSIKEYGE
jgi:hypothetical protein